MLERAVSDGRHSRAASAPSVAVNDLEVSYGGVRALRGVSLTLAEGEIICVLGNNSAGKSTLLRAVSGSLPLHRSVIVALRGGRPPRPRCSLVYGMRVTRDGGEAAPAQ